MSTFLSVDVFWVKLTQKFFNFHVKTVIRNDFFSSGKCSWQNFWQIHIRIIFYSSKFLRNDMRYTFRVKLTRFGSMKVNDFSNLVNSLRMWSIHHLFWSQSEWQMFLMIKNSYLEVYNRNLQSLFYSRRWHQVALGYTIHNI